MERYYDLLRKAEECTKDSAQSERLHYFRLALDFAHLEICYGDPSEAEIMSEIDRLEQGLHHFGVTQMMEMGCSPQEYAADMRHFYPLSWIFLPQWVQFAVSEDGERWEWRPKQKIDNPEVLATPDIYTYALETACTIGGEPNKHRYVRVMAVPLTEIPSWHRAAGQKAWIFTDEIVIK